MKFTVYGKPSCPACDEAKHLIQAKGHECEYVEMDIGQAKVEGKSYIRREDLILKFSSARVVPVIEYEQDGKVMPFITLTTLKGML